MLLFFKRLNSKKFKRFIPISFSIDAYDMCMLWILNFMNYVIKFCFTESTLSAEFLFSFPQNYSINFFNFDRLLYNRLTFFLIFSGKVLFWINLMKLFFLYCHIFFPLNISIYQYLNNCLFSLALSIVQTTIVAVILITRAICFTKWQFNSIWKFKSIYIRDNICKYICIYVFFF